MRDGKGIARERREHGATAVVVAIVLTLLASLTALVVNVGINLVLVPRIGFVGAAVSSTVAYALMLGISLIYLRFRLLISLRG